MPLNRWPRVLAITLLAQLVVQGRLAAQSRMGHISGTVTNAKHEPISGVNITITTRASTTFRKKLVTATDGTFATFLNYAPASYQFRFRKSGFVTVTRDRVVPIWTSPHEIQKHPLSTESAEMSILDTELVVDDSTARVRQ